MLKESESKILISSEYPPNTLGGIQRVAASFGEFAVDAGYNVTYIYPEKKRPKTDWLDPSEFGFDLLPLKVVNPNLPLLEKVPDRASMVCLKEKVKEPYKAVLINSPDVVGIQVFRNMPPEQREKVSVVWHHLLDFDPQEEVDTSSRRDFLSYVVTNPLYQLRLGLLRWSGLPYKSAVFVSETAQKSFQHAFPKIVPERQIVIPPATSLCHECKEIKVGPEVIDPRLRDTFCILTVSRISPKKGTGRLLEFARQLDSQIERTGKKVSFVVVGDIENRYGRWLRQEAEILGQSLKNCQFLFTGTIVDNERLCQIYTNSDLFFLPSSIETFGLVFAEAAAHGLPVMGLNKRASAETISQFGEAGFLIRGDMLRRDELERIKAHISSMMEFDLSTQQKLSMKMRKVALENFSPNILNQKLLTFIMES